MAKRKKLNLIVEDELWEKFKLKVPRGMTLNDAINKLIEMFLNGND